MKVTKYPQSCLKIEVDDVAILIDPGSITLAKYQLTDFGKINAVLYTHQHFDHFEPAILNELISQNIKIYANQDVADQVKSTNIEVVQSGVSFQVGSANITPYDLPHCLMQDGSAGPPNTGYIINNYFFHPGDGIEASGFEVYGLALPIAGPTINFTNAQTLADNLKAQKIIPIHYDYFKADPIEFAQLLAKDRVIPLIDGASTKL